MLAAAKISLDIGYKTVYDVPARLKMAEETIASAQEHKKRADEELSRMYEENFSQRRQRELREEWEEATWRASNARNLLMSNSVDIEYQKAVARQVAGLVREDCRNKLQALAARNSDLRVRRVVSDHKDEILKETDRMIATFSPARELQTDEVQKARVDAERLLRGASAD